MSPITAEEAIHLALEHHQSGRLADAEMIYRQVLAQLPDHADALHLLGVLAYQSGHFAAAIALIGRAISINPHAAHYHTNLGNALKDLGRLDDAIDAYRRAIALAPGLAEAHSNLGNALKDTGRLDEAIAAYRRAIQLNPGYAQAHNNLGGALEEQGQFDEALDACRRAIALKPGLAEAHINLGNVLKDLGRLDDAVNAYRRAIQLSPENAQAHSNLGCVLGEQGQLEEAIAACRQAMALKPDLAEAHGNLGNALRDQGRLDEAIDAYRRAIALKPDLAEAHNNLGNALKDQGRLDEAIAAYRRAVAVKPDLVRAASNLLLTLHYHPGHDARSILQEHRRWAGHFAQPLAPQVRPHPHPHSNPHPNHRAPGRRLRVGYVSRDFRDHPVGRLLLPLLSHHDRQRVEIVCYSDVRTGDAVTARLRTLADRWHHAVGVSDPQLAELVRADRIDILVDLALHTTNNRLLVFARKPAPVQVTMLGMPATTGLDTMDYRLTDPYLDPPGQGDGDYTEQSIRLPHCYWCYQPPEEAPPAGALPARENGFVTFGCLNHFAKSSRPALELWARVLQALPDSRLVLLSHPGTHRDAARGVFEAAGITRDRIVFAAREGRRAYFERYHHLDLSLDPFPYNGHTTSLDSLWMGVPVVTLERRTAVGRGGVSILSNLKLPELIARTPEEYLAIAVEWAQDRARLAALRAGLRQRMAASPLMDGQQYAADVEAAFRRMWMRWCGV